MRVLTAVLALILLLAGGECEGAPLPSPATAVAAAVKDLVKASPTARRHYRYLSLYPIHEAKERIAWGKALDFWCNSLSSESELIPAHRVSDSLLRIDVRDYGKAFAKAFEALSTVEPYFYSDQTDKRGRTVRAFGTAGIDPDFAVSLVALTRSRSPIVRGDAFLAITSQQVDRVGVGYYDFIGASSRKEFQALVGLDEKLAVKLQKETRAIVARSGVAINNRQIVRFATITGAYWFTLDVVNNRGKRNALRNLDADFVHDAEEIYGNLPNGLFAFFLSNAQGVKQDSVPDNIASDKTRPGNDARISFHNCVSCHSLGIQKIDDWGRKVFKGPLKLASPDYDQGRRFQRTYLSDLKRWVARDQADYGDVVFKLTGLKSSELSRSFSRLHTSYTEADLTLADVARESGYPEARVKQVLLAIATLTPPLDPVLSGLIAEEPESIRREHLDEAFPLLMLHLKGYLPAEKVKP